MGWRRGGASGSFSTREAKGNEVLEHPYWALGRPGASHLFKLHEALRRSVHGHPASPGAGGPRAGASETSRGLTLAGGWEGPWGRARWKGGGRVQGSEPRGPPVSPDAEALTLQSVPGLGPTPGQGPWGRALHTCAECPLEGTLQAEAARKEPCIQALIPAPASHSGCCRNTLPGGHHPLSYRTRAPTQRFKCKLIPGNRSKLMKHSAGWLLPPDSSNTRAVNRWPLGRIPFVFKNVKGSLPSTLHPRFMDF